MIRDLRPCWAPAALLLAFLASPAHCASWTFETLFGSAVNLPTPLSVSQRGHGDVYLYAEYHTRGLEEPLYYCVRASRWDRERAWELEFLHHKLYLKNPPAEIRDFSVSHGFNILSLNRAWRERWGVWRLGAGAVMAHPESEVRGRMLDGGGGHLGGGYSIAGPLVQAAAGKEFPFAKRFKAVFELKLTAAYLRLRVADGHADLTNLAAHVLFGVGFDLPRGRP